MEWIYLTQVKDQWWATVTTVMNLLGFIKCWQFLVWLSNS
jgi:hypothetical protein